MSRVVAASNDPSFLHERQLNATDESSRQEYGYCQIECYRLKSMRKKRGGPSPSKSAYWVSLPEGVPVHTYPPSQVPASSSTQCRYVSCSKQACDSPRSTSSESATSTISTIASTSDRRCVHFADGLMAGEDEPEETKPDNSLAEWIYVDRDICGRSLYQYEPGNFKDSVSHNAEEFFRELAFLEFVNAKMQQAAVQSKEGLMEYLLEESVLNRRLSQAGVKAKHLRAGFGARACRS